MELIDFIEEFASQFPDEDSCVFTPDTDFHELDSWTSMTGLSVAAMIWHKYNVEIESKDIREADTIEDLFNTVKERQ